MSALLTEPPSKCAQFAAIREAKERMFFAETNLDVADCLADFDWVVVASAEHDAARKSLVAALIAAEASGLMDELSGYLTATYGG